MLAWNSAWGFNTSDTKQTAKKRTEMSRISIFFSLVLALLLAGASNGKSEINFSKTTEVIDGRYYRQTTFRFDLKSSLSKERELLDPDFRSKVGITGDGKVKISSSAKTEMYLAGQLTNKPDGEPDIGLSWQESKRIKMDHLGNGVYEATVLLLDGATYDYKFVAWDMATFTKDPGNPKFEPKYGNSRITVTGEK
jgi:hypothetical protein